MVENKKGFTLVELVIVIVIVGILSVISVPIYKGYVDKAMMTEGKVLLGAIAKAELAHHVEYGYFWETWGSIDRRLDINASGNKYFTYFEAESGYASNVDTAASFAVSKTRLAATDDDNNDYVDIYVYGSRGNNGKGWVLHATQYASGALCGENGDIDVEDYLWK